MEAMAAESLIASAWELEGFLTRTRFPVKTEKGQYLGHIVRVRALSTREVLFMVLEGVQRRIAEGYGRRFGQPVLDAFRELLRYCAPAASGGGRVSEDLRVETVRRVRSIIGDDL